MNQSAADSRPRFTAKQGQYLAFIHAYKRLLGRSPAEAEMQRFFQVTPPSVHQMVLSLEKAGLITRKPGRTLHRSPRRSGRSSRADFTL